MSFLTQTDELVRLALLARENAYAPYSGFRVGAALLTTENHIFTGCNIENATYSPSNCAERTAIFKAVSEGARRFAEIAVIGAPEDSSDYQEFTVPCGVCLQVLLEFCDPASFAVIAANQQSGYRRYLLSELLPHAFRLEAGK